MDSKRTGSPPQPPAGAAVPTGGAGPEDGLGWLVKYGVCGAPAEAESFRARVLDSDEDDAADARDGRRPETARWRRWLRVGRPDPDDEAVRDAVLSWRIAALGNGPRHHLVRDL